MLKKLRSEGGRGVMWQRGGGVSRTKCGKAEGNTKINVAFPNVFVLFGVS
jgi:hypothetical protein